DAEQALCAQPGQNSPGRTQGCAQWLLQFSELSTWHQQIYPQDVFGTGGILVLTFQMGRVSSAET
ncbi:MAG: hypothetical protein WBG39_11070, partial [Gordonia sp. (in: high G+C Gram-positive bacteria)]